MFRDSRGVVHTVAAPDPLDDLPAGAAAALQRALLQPVRGDVDAALDRCEAARELLERWQDAFFAALPAEVDLEEEARWAAEAGLSLEEVEATEHAYPDEDGDQDDDEDDEPADATDGTDPVLLGEPDLDLPGPDPDDPRRVLGDELVAVLERELLLLPLRVRLEALVAGADLVAGWADLLVDPEKTLGHLLLAHSAPPPLDRVPDDDLAAFLADAHAAAHAGTGPGHPDGRTLA